MKTKDEETNIKRLKEKAKVCDNEMVHMYYDEIIYAIAKKYEPIKVKQIDKIVNGIHFWYS